MNVAEAVCCFGLGVLVSYLIARIILLMFYVVKRK